MNENDKNVMSLTKQNNHFLPYNIKNILKIIFNVCNLYLYFNLKY